MSGLLRLGSNRLWTPGQIKPTGIPRIDWSHPLARGLLFYAFDTGMGMRVDLVSGVLAQKNSTSTVNPTAGATAYGSTIFYQGGQADAFANIGAGITSAIGSIAWALIAPASPSQNATGAFEYDVGAAGFDCEFHNLTSGQLRLSCYEYTVGGVFFIAPTQVDNTYLSAVETMDGATRTIYGNGVVPATQGTQPCTVNVIGLQTPSNTPSNLAIGDYTAYGGAPDIDEFTGSVFYWALWNRVLSAQEAMQLHLDPYCFLLPQYPAGVIKAAAWGGAAPELPTVRRRFIARPD